MTVKTQWRNVIIFALSLLGFVILIYTLNGKNATPESVQQTDEQLIAKEKEIADEYKAKMESKGDAGKPCCRRDESLVGPISVIKKPPESLTLLERQLPFVKLGGRWDPPSCKSPVKVAIIVAYRNRMESLLVFLGHLHPMLRRQHLDYQLFIVEQSEHYAFNKGKLQNIGFKEAMKYDTFDCVVFHDVDLIPEDERNYYGCPTSPRHMSPSLDKFDSNIHSPDTFGGVLAFLKKDFEDVNGYSNRFYGVEGENEDMLARIRDHKKRVTSPVLELGRYAMLKHKPRLEKKEKGHPEQRKKASKEAGDGLKRLRYKILHNDQYNLFTLIKVDLLWDLSEHEAF